MAGTMTRADLVADLRASLQDAANVFTAAHDADFARHLDHAAIDLGRFRPRTLVGTLTLVADQANYAAPAGLLRPKAPLWGMAQRHATRPWENGWPGPLPRLRLIEGTGGRELWLTPAPTAAQIDTLGAAYRYFYYGGHQVGDQEIDTTVPVTDRYLLLLRAQAEAMKEMAARNIHKPIQTRDGVGSAPRNGTPAALYAQLLEDFERLAAA